MKNSGQWSVASGQGRKSFSPFVLFLIGAFVVAVIFIIFPEIDLYVAKLFYVPGRRFYLDDNIILVIIRKIVTLTTTCLIILWTGLIIATSVTKKPVWGLSRLRVIYLFVVLIVGPGLVVNSVFKEHWGRPRPTHLDIFGKNMTFTPAFFITDQCKTNCSFVSGDVSVGFYFLALALAIPKRRKLFIGVGLGLGVIFSITRIMQGGHFLSDTIFAGVFTFIVAYWLYLGLLKLEARRQ